MRIPSYWRKADMPLQTPQGATWTIEAWGWSDASEEQAAAHARELLKAQAAAIAAGRPRERYLYHDRPLREEILDRCAPGVLITRNRYGAEILNTEQVAFVDVDLDLRSGRPGFFARLFGAHDPGPQQAVADQVEVLRAALKGIASARVYRTHSGLRLLLTDRLHVPHEPQTLSMLEALGSDPLYRTLCREQRCFRARLTPKPWRVGLRDMPGRWPYADPQGVEAWVARYRTRCEQLASTRYLETLGDEAELAEVRAVVELHDRLSGAHSGRELA